jgi:hypothetical protein
MTDEQVIPSYCKYCNVLVGSIHDGTLLHSKIQYTTVNYNSSNTRTTSTGSLTQLSELFKLSLSSFEISLLYTTLP